MWKEDKLVKYLCTDQYVPMAYRARKNARKSLEVEGLTMTVRPSIGGKKAHSTDVVFDRPSWFFLFLIPAAVIFSFLVFFPTTAATTGSSRGRRNIFFHGHGCAPTRGMRCGSSVESFLMTEQNELPPTFDADLSDMLTNLDRTFFQYHREFNWTRKSVMYVI